MALVLFGWAGFDMSFWLLWLTLLFIKATMTKNHLQTIYLSIIKRWTSMQYGLQVDLCLENVDYFIMGCIVGIVCPIPKPLRMYEQLRQLHHQIYSKTQANEIQSKSEFSMKKDKPSKENFYGFSRQHQEHSYKKVKQPVTVRRENHEPTKKHHKKKYRKARYEQWDKPYHTQAIYEPWQGPYSGCTGKWINRYQFKTQDRAFGYFQCLKCNNKWMSVHSKKYYKQGCKICKRKYYPYYLWRSDFNDQEKIRIIRLWKHLYELCQACNKGVCSFDLAEYQKTQDQTEPFVSD